MVPALPIDGKQGRIQDSLLGCPAKLVIDLAMTPLNNLGLKETSGGHNLLHFLSDKTLHLHKSPGNNVFREVMDSL